MCDIIKKNIIEVYSYFSNLIIRYLENVLFNDFSLFLEEVDLLMENEDYNKLTIKFKNYNINDSLKNIELYILQIVFFTNNIYKKWVYIICNNLNSNETNKYIYKGESLTNIKDELRLVFLNDDFYQLFKSLKIKSKLDCIKSLFGSINDFKNGEYIYLKNIKIFYHDIKEDFKVILSYIVTRRELFKQKCLQYFGNNINKLLNNVAIDRNKIFERMRKILKEDFELFAKEEHN